MADSTTSTFSLKNGAEAAYSDAHHDFGSIYSKKIVKVELPNEISDDYKDLTEDKFFSNSILNTSPDSFETFKKSTEINPRQFDGEDIFNVEVKNDYEIITYNNKNISNIPKDKSVLQVELNRLGITEDVFIICDVAYSWIKKDLEKANSDNKEQIFWWTQTIETGFDPAGKTAWHTLPVFKDPTKNFKFCWQYLSTSHKPDKLYIPWTVENNKPLQQIEIQTNKNAMMCLNKQILMVCRTKNTNYHDYRKHQSYLLIYDKNKKRYVYADKSMSAKNYKMSHIQSSGYKSFGKQLIEIYNAIFGNINKNINTLLTNYTTQYQILAKRFGDMPQALACLDDNIVFQTFINENLPIKTAFDKSNIGFPKDDNFKKNRHIVLDNKDSEGGGVFKTNGKNMFVSYDRIAIAQAINYRVPIVFFDQQDGFKLFVKKSLLSETEHIKKMFILSDQQGPRWSITENGKTTFFKYGEIQRDGIFDDISNNITQNYEFVESIIKYFNTLSPNISNTADYQNFLKIFCINLVNLELINNLGITSGVNNWIEKLNFDFNNKINDLELQIVFPNPNYYLITSNITINKKYIDYIATIIFSKFFKQPYNENNYANINLSSQNDLTQLRLFKSKISLFKSYLQSVYDEIRYCEKNMEIIVNTTNNNIPESFEQHINDITLKFSELPEKITRQNQRAIDIIRKSDELLFGLLETFYKKENVIRPIWTSINNLNNDIFPNISKSFKDVVLNSCKLLRNDIPLSAEVTQSVVNEAYDNVKELFEENNSLMNGGAGGDDKKRDGIKKRLDGEKSRKIRTKNWLTLVNNKRDKLREQNRNNTNYISFENLIENAKSDKISYETIINLDSLIRNIIHIYSSYFINNIIRKPNTWGKIDISNRQEKATFLLGNVKEDENAIMQEDKNKVKVMEDGDLLKRKGESDNNGVDTMQYNEYDKEYNYIDKFYKYCFNVLEIKQQKEKRQRTQGGDPPHDEEGENLFLFNPLENKVLNSKIAFKDSYGKMHELSKILYYSINQRYVPDDLILYPNDNDVINFFNKEIKNNVFDKISEIIDNLDEKYAEMYEKMAAEINTPTIEEAGQDRQQQLQQSWQQPSWQQPVIAIGGKKKKITKNKRKKNKITKSKRKKNKITKKKRKKNKITKKR